MDFIDLHVHSSCSDGTLSPAQVTSLAAQNGLRAIALTDHDTVSGISEALEAGKKLGVEIIPGIELSTNYQNRDIHIVGLHINPCDAYFLETLKEFQSSRDQRNEKIIGLLQQAGISISRKAMEDTFPDCVWTRAHFARYLMEHGYVSSVREAFPRYLGDHAPCFVPREKVTPWQAISFPDCEEPDWMERKCFIPPTAERKNVSLGSWPGTMISPLLAVRIFTGTINRIFPWEPGGAI